MDRAWGKLTAARRHKAALEHFDGMFLIVDIESEPGTIRNKIRPRQPYFLCTLTLLSDGPDVHMYVHMH